MTKWLNSFIRYLGCYDYYNYKQENEKKKTAE